MIKKILIGIAFFIAILWCISFITGYTIILKTQEPVLSEYGEIQKGGTISVLENLNFEDGEWSAYLIICYSDFQKLNQVIPRRTCLKLQDISIMKKMRDEWEMVYTGGDIATVQSSIVFFKDGKVVFESGIILDEKKEGLQSQEFGWIEPLSKGVMVKYCKEFKQVYWPIIIL